MRNFKLQSLKNSRTFNICIQKKIFKLNISGILLPSLSINRPSPHHRFDYLPERTVHAMFPDSDEHHRSMIQSLVTPFY